MNDGFKRFVARVKAESLIKALLGSLSASLLAAGIPLLILKLLKINIPFWSYIIIGIGVFALTFLIYFLLRPSDMRIARRIDNELGLKEKVQTMLEYKDKEGFLVDIQREDTNKRLNEAPIKGVRIKIHFVYGIALAIAIATLATSIALPTVAAAPPKEEDKEYEDDPYTIQRLKDLIEFVKASNCNKDYKLRAVKRLEALIPLIENAKLESEMKEAVLSTIAGLGDDLEVSNSHKLVYDYALNQAKDANGVYMANLVKTLAPDKLVALSDTMKNQIAFDKKTGLEAMTNGKKSFMDLLVASPLQKSYKDDELFKAIADLGNTCYDIASYIQADELDLNKANEAIDASIAEVKAALVMQICNNDTFAYLELELKTLFNLLEDKPTEPDKPTNPNIEPPTEDSTEDDNKGDNEGGFGEGDILFGSDDLFYDPVLGYVEYGKVLEAYRAQIEKDVVEGTLTPEMIEFYREYYKNLTEKQDKEI